MSLIEGATEALVTTQHLVNIVVPLVGEQGVKRLDYRTDPLLLRAVGNCMVIRFVSNPVIELVTATSADVSYNIRAVHYNRDSSSVPTNTASIAAIPGSIEIIRSQIQNLNRVAIGSTPAVTDLIKPDPTVGYSPCLDVAWDSLGTDASAIVQLIVHCIVVSSGSDLPDYT